MTSKTRVPGSGIKKSYKYETLTRKQKESYAQRKEDFAGRENTWGDKIADTYAKNPSLASTRNTKAWKNRRRTYILIFPDGKIVRTINLKNYCKRNGYTDSHLNRISKYHAGDPLGGSRFYKGIDCYKQGTLRDGKRRP